MTAAMLADADNIALIIADAAVQRGYPPDSH